VAWGLVSRAGLGFGGTPPLFFHGQRNENFTMAPKGTFCFVAITLRNCKRKSRNYLGIYVAQVVQGDPPQILQKARMAIFSKIFDKFLNLWLTIPQQKEYEKSKTIGFINDYVPDYIQPQIWWQLVKQSRRNVGTKSVQ